MTTTTAPLRVVVESGSDVGALVVAIIAVVLATGSLAWQIASHVLTGPRLKARLVRGFKVCDGSDDRAAGR